MRASAATRRHCGCRRSGVKTDRSQPWRHQRSVAAVAIFVSRHVATFIVVYCRSMKHGLLRGRAAMGIKAATAKKKDAPTRRKKPSHIVVLIHGIRTQASWAEMIASVFKSKTDALVQPIRYGYFSALGFLSPLFTRTFPIKRITRELQDIRADNPNAKISVIAHSFGTYALLNVLKDPAIRLHRIVLCGSIVPTSFRRAQFKAQLDDSPILNDCGTHDIWPVLAQSLTWGYGATGTFGFGTFGVHDRFNKFGHSDYFDANFVETYWVPFISDGTILPTDWEKVRRTPPAWQSILAWLPLQWIFLIAVLGWASYAVLAPLFAAPQAVLRIERVSLAHWLGTPMIAPAVRAENSSLRELSITDLRASLYSPDNQRYDLTIEGYYEINQQQMLPFQELNISYNESRYIVISLIGNISETYPMAVKAQNYVNIKTDFSRRWVDPERLLEEEVLQEATETAERQFPWQEGRWRLATVYRVNKIANTSDTYFELSKSQVSQLRSIISQYKTGAGVLQMWRTTAVGGVGSWVEVDIAQPNASESAGIPEEG
jgi:pimeloyl-ACP methyl ester carboxylesterase